jgi:hypothetical protein
LIYKKSKESKNSNKFFDPYQIPNESKKFVPKKLFYSNDS